MEFTVLLKLYIDISFIQSQKDKENVAQRNKINLCKIVSFDLFMLALDMLFSAGHEVWIQLHLMYLIRSESDICKACLFFTQCPFRISLYILQKSFHFFLEFLL